MMTLNRFTHGTFHSKYIGLEHCESEHDKPTYEPYLRQVINKSS